MVLRERVKESLGYPKVPTSQAIGLESECPERRTDEVLAQVQKGKEPESQNLKRKLTTAKQAHEDEKPRYVGRGRNGDPIALDPDY
ncbi:hypothetical protein PENDEC_c002G02105 [Penicillium decumbens]|uniref:Uncharacterized protein n=1 Tax=Penicillium decumbens TaxID=69771 RepID=A0A1V6PLT3_PENDC|nr:hypothetical protein PENDEC_c002G02105 [Penicillium decumbens]